MTSNCTRFTIVHYPNGYAVVKARFYSSEAGAIQHAMRSAKDCGEFVDVIWKGGRTFAVVGEKGVVGPTGKYPATFVTR